MEALNDILVFNRATLVAGPTMNSFRYVWPGAQTFKNSMVAIKSISKPYSWPNITAAYGNNTYQVNWPLTQLTGSTTSMTTYTITMPDGFYIFENSGNTFNTYLQQYCFNNSLYLIGTGLTSSQGVTTIAGKIYYFISAQQNSTYYSIEFDFFPLPLSADIAVGTGKAYQYPTGWPTTTTGFTSNFTPQLVVPAATTQYSFSSYIGFAPGTYPTLSYDATNVNVGIQSTFAPQVTPVQSIIVCLSIVSNRVGLNPNVIGTFGISNTKYGSNIIYEPSANWYSKVLDGTFNNATLTFYNQDFVALPIYDPSIVAEISLVIKAT